MLPAAGWSLRHRVQGEDSPIPSLAQHIGILGALAAWRVTQGIYRFDPTTFDAIWKIAVTGDIPTEVLFHLPEWCVYIPTPDQTWQGATLNGFFAHLEQDINDRRTELRLVLDVTGAAGDELIVMPIHLGKGGVTEGVEAMLKEAARQFPVRVQTPEGVIERLSSDISPLVSLALYLCSQAAEIKETGAGKRVPDSSQAPEDQEGHADLRPGSSEPLGGRLSSGGCTEAGVVGVRTSGTNRHSCKPTTAYPQCALALILGGQEGPA